MQAARIWFQNSNPPLTLLQVKQHLQGLDVDVKDAEWRLGNFVVPQLQISSPAHFLTQLEDMEWVIEEAEEFSEHAPEFIRDKLSVCDARLAFGDASDVGNTLDHGGFVAAGWTHFDPAEPQTMALLKALTVLVDGILEDNTEGTWWVPA